MPRIPTVLTAAICSIGARTLFAQVPAPPPIALIAVTRASAVAAALQYGTGGEIARADTLIAQAQLAQARALPNPMLSSSYSKSAPQWHGSIDIPIYPPWLRALRIAGAEASRSSAALRFAYTRASVRYEAEVAYGLALVARERAALSALAARDADSLQALAGLQRDAGAASDMDVEMATINADQQANITMADSLAAIGALLDMQVLMGVPGDRPRLALQESLALLLADVEASDTAVSSVGVTTDLSTSNGGRTTLPLFVAAAEAALHSQEIAVRLARRRNWILPSLQLGVEGGDPTGGPRGPLPTLGVSIPLPLFNRYRGDLSLAEANQQRAAAELQGARRAATASAARAQRELNAARQRLVRDRRLVSFARILAAKSITAYGAGATPLSEVLQAHRTARDAIALYVNDVIVLTTAVAAVRFATATASP